mmetsp:Transcript_24436/g.56636  ORF Transcript_24436/g.56636 Transcript_24436/m.56636 type:complete len:290 (+) Transcript_24436:599-1468(+)
MLMQLQKLVLDHPACSEVGLVVHVRWKLPAVQERQAVDCQDSQSLAIEVLEETFRLAPVVQRLQTRGERHAVHTARAVVIQEAKHVRGAVPESVPDQELEASKFHCRDRVKIQEGDDAAVSLVHVLPQSRDVAAKSDVHALPLELPHSKLHVRLRVKDEPCPGWIAIPPICEVQELHQSMKSPLHHRLRLRKSFFFRLLRIKGSLVRGLAPMSRRHSRALRGCRPASYQGLESRRTGSGLARARTCRASRRPRGARRVRGLGVCWGGGFGPASVSAVSRLLQELGPWRW